MSSFALFIRLKLVRYSSSSLLKFFNLSCAFSALVCTGSCLASLPYSSMVRANDVRDALSWAWRCGEGDAESANWSRSFRIDVDCRRAELKRAFYLRREFAVRYASLG